MRNTITKTVSMMLVTVVVLGIAVMPMRAEAAFTDITTLTPAGTWLKVIEYTWEIAKVMIQSTTTSEVEAAASQFSAYFEPSLTDSFLYVTAEQMNQLSTQLAQNGISVYPTGVPGRELIALALQDNTVNTATGTVTLDADVGDYYTYSGKTVVRVGVDGAAGEDFDSYSGTSSTDSTVGITPEGGLVDIPVEKKDTGETVPGATIDFDINNWKVKLENGTYTDIENFYFNPITQTYDITTVDNRHYTYQFYYDYTYITYIGSSAEYREAYKVYYELPDGRSSGDLTADELKGLSLQFDMVNYDKASSDTLTRALYDFDGDLQNSSAFDSTATWVSGSSTTYLEAPDGFGGCLFNNNPFDLRFSLDGVSNEAYTVQFRLYFENLPTSDFFVYAYGNPWFIVGDRYEDSGSFVTVSPNLGIFSFTLGLDDQFLPILRINQGNVYFPNSSTVITSIQAGQWYDFTLCFDWSIYSTSLSERPPSFESLYCYVNGLLVGSASIRRLGYLYFDDGAFYLGMRRYGNNFGPFTFSTTGIILNQGFSASSESSWRAAGFTNFWWYPASIDEFYAYVSNGSSSYFPKVAGDYIPPYQFNYLGFKCDGSYTMMLDNLRVVNHSLYSGVQSFTPTPVPFSPNLVYVLPSVSDLNDNTVAIMSQLPVSGYRVGGIRPTDPTLASGYVYMHIDGEYIDSVQQWNGAYWEEVTARLYTGIRWIPVTAFNVFTLEDMFDIIDPDADGSGDNVDDIYKYYLWWSGEWGSFQQWLQGTMQTLIEAIQASGGGGGGSDAPVVIVPGYNDQTTTSEITTENPDGSTTKTTIVSNAAGLVYSNSVTTYPTDANGNTKTITVYTDSSGVMYQTETTIDRDGNVTVTEPTKATGTLGSILKMITNGVMSIAGTVIEGFVTIVVDGVKFIIESADSLFTGIGDLISNAANSVTDATNSISNILDRPTGGSGDIEEHVDGAPVPILQAIFDPIPVELKTIMVAMFVVPIVFALFGKIHF